MTLTGMDREKATDGGGGLTTTTEAMDDGRY
jgi:hypothetical protein